MLELVVYGSLSSLCYGSPSLWQTFAVAFTC